MNLVEQYGQRIALAEQVYEKRHAGSMDSLKKLTVAQCLKNVEGFLNESFSSDQGTQRGDLGEWKKFVAELH